MTPDPNPLNTPISRRQILTTAAAGAGAIAASSLTIMVPRAKAADKLRILSWAGYDERDVIGAFEEEFNVEVEFKTYVGGEQMLQFFNQTPRGTYDAVISDAEFVQKLAEIGAIEALNREDLPNLEDFYPEYQTFPGYLLDGDLMAAGTRFGVYGIAFNTNYLDPESVKSWEVLFDPELRDQVCMFDWYLPNMGNASLALFPDKDNPYDLTEAELEQVKEWMVELKPNIALITPNIQDLSNAFVNESVVAGPVGDWLIQNVIAEGNTNFTAVVPEEGAIRWSEGAALCADSQNKELALEWVKYMTRPETQANLANADAYKGIAVNPKAIEHLDEDQKQLLGYVPHPDEEDKLIVEVNLERTRARSLPPNEKDWQDRYNEFKTS